MVIVLSALTNITLCKFVRFFFPKLMYTGFRVSVLIRNSMIQLEVMCVLFSEMHFSDVYC